MSARFDLTQGVMRTTAGRRLEDKPDIATVPCWLYLSAASGSTDKQIVGKLPKRARILRVIPLEPVAAGTYRMDLEAVTSPEIAGTVVVAATTSMTSRAFSTVGAALGVAYEAERDISVTCASGTAGGTVRFGVEILPEINTAIPN